MQNTVTGCWCRIRENGLGGSSVNPLGVPTVRPGPPFLGAAPTSWDEWWLSARGWTRRSSNGKSGPKMFNVGCFKMECQASVIVLHISQHFCRTLTECSAL